MTSIEEEVVSYVAATGDLETVLAGGITAEHFLDPRNKKVFADILSFKEDFGEAPSPDVILRDHPTYPFTTESSGPLPYLLRELHETRRRTIIDLGLGAIAETADKEGSEQALAVARLMIAQAAVDTLSSREVDYAATGAVRLARYKEARENPGAMVGMPTGFAFLDRATLGLQRQQMIVLTGLAKSCKTTVMLGIIRTVYDWGANILVISFEMPEVEISRRMDGFGAEINPKKLQTGEYNDSEWRRLQRKLTLTEMEPDPRPLLISEDRAGTMTLSGIQAKIDQYKPDVVFIDGAYFLLDEMTKESGTPMAMTNISRGIKKLALNNDITLVVTTQSLHSKLGRNGLSAHSLGYTSAWVQDADVVIGMEASDDEGDYRMKILASRNAPPQEHLISISWEPPKFEEAELEDQKDHPW